MISLVDSLVLMVLFLCGGTACGIHLLGDQIYLLFISAIGNALFITVAAALTMIPVFYLQSTSFAILFLLIIAFDPINIVLTLFTQLSLRNAVPIPQVIGVIAYLAIAYGLTVLVFNKRELDF